ncbi:MAG: hypothetical protein SPL80_02450 [Bacilli bacterium]|nr:hypothetical protein [Bacilli bacterium]
MDLFTSLSLHYPSSLVSSLKESMEGKSVHALYRNPLKISESDLLSLTSSLKSHPFVPNAYYFDPEVEELGKSMLFNLGAFYILDAASLLVPYFLNPKPGERILDMAAAPGGKTCLSAMMMEGEGVILSNDLSFSRSKETSSNVERLGLSNVAVTSGDFAAAYRNYESYFDAVLLDAPCSGSAMIRKDPRLLSDWSEEKVARCASIQKELLDLASKMVVNGGRIMYSTCSFSYEEDEAVVLDFLKTHPQFHAFSVEEHEGFYHHEDLKEGVHLFPHLYAGEGQFFCLLQKEGEKESHPIERSKPLKMPSSILPYIKESGLESCDLKLHSGAYYGLTEALRIEGLSLLRYGVRIGEEKNPFSPDHALAVFNHRIPSISLEKEKALAYLRGETFPQQVSDGYHVVSYLKMNLGWVKVTHGIAKNHYPKGLRRRYSDPLNP